MSVSWHKIDWCGILFMLFLCITVPTCIYQGGKTAQMRLQFESSQCDCHEDSKKGE